MQNVCIHVKQHHLACTQHLSGQESGHRLNDSLCTETSNSWWSCEDPKQQVHDPVGASAYGRGGGGSRSVCCLCEQWTVKAFLLELVRTLCSLQTSQEAKHSINDKIEISKYSSIHFQHIQLDKRFTSLCAVIHYLCLKGLSSMGIKQDKQKQHKQNYNIKTYMNKAINPHRYASNE